MTTLQFLVPAISCGHCVHTIQSELGALDGVRRVVAAQDTRQVTVDFEPPADETGIVALLTEINYPPAA
jgi:copper chaperone CopZ